MPNEYPRRSSCCRRKSRLRLFQKLFGASAKRGSSDRDEMNGVSESFKDAQNSSVPSCLPPSIRASNPASSSAAEQVDFVRRK